MTPGDWPKEDELLDGAVTLVYEPAGRSGAVTITAKYNGEVVHSGVVDNIKDTGHAGVTARGTYSTHAKEAVEEVDGLDESDLETAIDRWFNGFLNNADVADDDLQGDMADEIISGTQTPVKIHGGAEDTTTYNVDLTFRGRTNTLEFNADTMVPGSGPGALESKLAHQYFEPVEVPKEDWEDIREYWANNAEVATVTETTPTGARADRVLEYLSDSLNPVPDMEMLENGKRNAWVDTGYDRKPDVDDVDPDAVVWVQDRHFVDEIESVSSVDDKGTIVHQLQKRAQLVDKWRSRRAPDHNGSDRDRPPLWGFTPGVLRIDPDDVTEIEAGGGVEP